MSGSTYCYIGPRHIGYYSTIDPALQAAALRFGVPLGLLEAMTYTESTWGLTRMPEYLSAFNNRIPSFLSYAQDTIQGQADLAASYLAWLYGRFGGDWHAAVGAYNAGPNGYAANPAIAQPYIDKVFSLVTAQDIPDPVQGPATVTPPQVTLGANQRIVATITLRNGSCQPLRWMVTVTAYAPDVPGLQVTVWSPNPATGTLGPDAGPITVQQVSQILPVAPKGVGLTFGGATYAAPVSRVAFTLTWTVVNLGAVHDVWTVTADRAVVVPLVL